MNKKDELKARRKELYNQILQKQKLVSSAYRIYSNQKASYQKLVLEYERVDEALAEIDGRLVIVDLRRSTRASPSIKNLSKEQKEELINALIGG